MTSMADIWHSKAILPWVTSSTLKIMRTKVLCTQNTTYLIKTFSNVILFFSELCTLDAYDCKFGIKILVQAREKDRSIYIYIHNEPFIVLKLIDGLLEILNWY